MISQLFQPNDVAKLSAIDMVDPGTDIAKNDPYAKKVYQFVEVSLAECEQIATNGPYLS